MCGIAALFGNLPSREVIAKMTNLVAHRGLDAEGFLFFSGKRGDIAHLGHRRLSILDLSEHGNQPMSSPDGRFHITYNGEIYNYLELKQELKKKGHRFFTDCDTEVLLAAFSEWGSRCLPKLNGMFAFVIYDSFNRRIFAARDRFGIKPLYYWVSPSNAVAFASEIKQFTALPDFCPRLNHQRAYDYLNWNLSDHTAETLFYGVMQIKGGEYWEGGIDEFALRPRRWYAPLEKPYKGPLKEAADHFQKLLADSISLRLRADVPVGSCLSGGLDSSSIVCLIRKLLPENAHQATFSACSDVPSCDEREFMDHVVLKTQHQAHFTTPALSTLLSDLDNLIWHQDEPFMTTGIFAQWEVFKLARRHQVRVMLDGQGADEQLGGYGSCYYFHFYELFRSLQWKTLLKELSYSKPAVNPYTALGSRLLPAQVKNVLRRFLGRSSTKPSWISLQAEDLDPFAGMMDAGLSEYCRHMMSFSPLPKLLHYEDRNSMAHSIEARTPFLDWRLVEFTLNLPQECKISDGLTKRVLRESMKEELPKEILQRRDKMGFATAEKEWIKDLEMRVLLEKGIEASSGVISPQVLDDYDRMVEGSGSFSDRYWKTICFGRWMERFSVGY